MYFISGREVCATLSHTLCRAKPLRGTADEVEQGIFSKYQHSLKMAKARGVLDDVDMVFPHDLKSTHHIHNAHHALS